MDLRRVGGGLNMIKACKILSKVIKFEKLSFHLNKDNFEGEKISL